MGGTTPRFGIRFPYQSEPVTLAHFKNLADDVDAALVQVLTLRGLALHMPAAKVSGPSVGSGATTINPNTVTTLAIAGGTSGSTLWYDNNAMFTVGQNDRLTCKTAGIYSIMASVSGGSGPSALNAFEMWAAVYRSAVEQKRFQHKNNTENQTTIGAWQVSGVWPLLVNDYVSVRGWFSGTGTLTPTNVTLAMTCISLL